MAMAVYGIAICILFVLVRVQQTAQKQTLKALEQQNAINLTFNDMITQIYNSITKEDK